MTEPSVDHEVAHRHHSLRRGMDDLRGRESYLPILLLAVGMMISFPLGELSKWLAALVMVPMALALVLLSYRRATMRRRTRQILTVVAVVGVATALCGTAFAASGTPNEGLMAAITSATFGFLLLLTLPAIAERALQHQRVTLNTLAAALAAYLIIGLFFSTFFHFLGAINDNHFFAQTDSPGMGDYQYFSFVTLTTVGFGDLTAGTQLGKATVIFEAVLGQVFLVTMVARVVSNLGRERAPAAELAERDGAGPEGPAPDQH